MKGMKSLIILFVGIVFTVVMLSSCATESENVALGTAAGAGIGSAVSHNKWKGAVIGGILGAVAGEAYHQIQQQAINESINRQKPVMYRKNTSNGWQEVEAAPVSKQYYNPNKHTKCQKIHIRIVENGRLVKDRVKEVCKGIKETNEY